MKKVHINNEGKRIIEPGTIQQSVGGCQLGFDDDGINLIESNFEIQGKRLEIDQ